MLSQIIMVNKYYKSDQKIRYFPSPYLDSHIFVIGIQSIIPVRRDGMGCCAPGLGLLQSSGSRFGYLICEQFNVNCFVNHTCIT